MFLNNDLKKLIENFPIFLQQSLELHAAKDQIIEIILDLGRRPEIRFISGSETLSQKLISWQDIDLIVERINKFDKENRTGIERTLHRISCIRNRQFLIIGLTCRIGRIILGAISIIRDLLELNKSILILGQPGVGKTTIIREMGRVLANEMKKRVIIIDTSNEIAGNSDITSLGIGCARIMQVYKPELQHEIMLEAVENHMPQIIIIDEIGTELEAINAQIIAEKGVKLIGTTHGNCLKNLIKNPVIVNLIGGIQYVILSDEEAKRRNMNKSILERKFFPAFDILIEINNFNSWIIHENLKTSIDFSLQNKHLVSQTRHSSTAEKTKIKLSNLRIPVNFGFKEHKTLLNFQRHINKNWNRINKESINYRNFTSIKQLIIYPYCISNNFLKEIFNQIGINFKITKNIKDATLIIGLKKYLKINLKLKNFAQLKKVPIYSCLLYTSPSPRD